MKKIYQTNTTNSKGNCMQAAYATLFQLELEEVPNFVEFGEGEWFDKLFEFYLSQGYEYNYTLNNANLYDVLKEKSGFIKKPKDTFSDLPNEKSINNLFAAVVYSPKYFNIEEENQVCHQVLIDKYFNIVHDPNPNYQDLEKYPLADEIGYNGIISVEIVSKIEV